MTKAETENRIFTYAEAVELMPMVRRLTEQAYRQVASLASAGGTEEDVRVRTDAVVGEWVRALVELGLEVKGLWLVDFDNGSGYYCWRHPEPGLGWFHGYDEGFAGRIRIQ